MADNLIKISELQPTTQLKSADRIPIEQDGETRSIKGAVLEQSLLGKTDDRYIENAQKGQPNGVATLDANGNLVQPAKDALKPSDIGVTVAGLDSEGKIPNEQLKFGSVAEGDSDVVSGGEVFTAIEDNNTLYNPFYGNDTYIKNKTILGISNADVLDYDSDLELIVFRNVSSGVGFNRIVQFAKKGNRKNIICQWYLQNTEDPGALDGIRDISLTQVSNSGVSFSMKIDFTKIKEQDIRNTGLFLDVKKIKDTNIEIGLDVKDVVISLTKSDGSGLLEKNNDYRFKNPVSELFLRKLSGQNKDLEVLFVGDSLTGLTTGVSLFTEEEKTDKQPSFISDYWTYKMYDWLCINKPKTYRLNSSFFNNTGSRVVIDAGKLNNPANFGEHSTTCETFTSNQSDFGFSYVFSKEFEKSSIIFSRYTDGVDSIIEITEGNGILECSENKTDWVELNNYTLSHNSNPNGYTEQYCEANGIALNTRHRRLWIRRKQNIDVNIKVSKKDNTVGSVYFYGVDFWNGNTIHFTNIARGGRHIRLLGFSMSDIIDRNPDLVLFEMPLANEMTFSIGNNKTYYRNYMNSLKTKTNDFEKISFAFFIASDRAENWKYNQPVIGRSIDILPYNKYNEILGDMYRYDNKNISFFNLRNAVINECVINGGIEMNMKNKITYDGTHLTQIGSDLYFKFLKNIFDY